MMRTYLLKLAQLSKTQTFKKWWKFCYRTTLFYFSIGFACGILGAIIAVVLGYNGEIIGNVLYVIIGIPLSIMVYKMILSTKLDGITIRTLLGNK